MLRADDRLELIGVLAGVFVVLVGLGTLVGMPWAHHSSIAITLGRVVGTLGTIAVGLGIVWLTRTAQ
ncbi:hypothetical protein BRC81_16215 [Halobacteriales archaeon QS_1_68_20]|nr:MAG: hypothetical protein BRC81_16215 [Halobacteriales archaeon QS_1_68_20]